MNFTTEYVGNAHNDSPHMWRGHLELDGDKVSASNFCLPNLGPRLYRLASALHEGNGLVVVRGLDPLDYSEEDNLIIFLGLGSYFGQQRGKQTDDGGVLSHLHSPRAMKDPHSLRPIKYSQRFVEFHNDIGCDILAMQTRSLPASGGDQLYASIATVFDYISTVRPDLAAELLAPRWTFDIERRWSSIEYRAVIFQHEGRVLSSLIPDALLGPPGAPQPTNLPPINAKQREALEFLQEVATRFQVTVRTEPGDLTFVNNRAVIHGREAFEDDPDDSRYIVRLWLKNERLAWDLPEPLQLANYMVFHDQSLPEKWNISRLDNVKFQVYEKLAP
ncbi:hypothetical protein E8E14_002042 [Neopestalotiopsis sp. 37M]|nr:hypothetical protein E8E14_002042 [Neopestalotiopsis sp. 37M]